MTVCSSHNGHRTSLEECGACQKSTNTNLLPACPHPCYPALLCARLSFPPQTGIQLHLSPWRFLTVPGSINQPLVWWNIQSWGSEEGVDALVPSCFAGASRQKPAFKGRVEARNTVACWCWCCTGSPSSVLHWLCLVSFLLRCPGFASFKDLFSIPGLSTRGPSLLFLGSSVNLCSHCCSKSSP